MRSADDRIPGGRRNAGGRSRRSVLRAGAGAALAALTLPGCDLLGGEPEPEPAPDPLAPLLSATADLLGRYDAALAAHPDLAARLTPIRDAHAAHLVELATLVGTPPPTAPGASTGPAGTAGPGVRTGSPDATADARGALAALRAAERTAQRQAAEACLAAAPQRAPLLGSIAAARASHAEALR